MISWKEKVAGKLSRLLADTPSSNHAHVATDSPLVLPGPPQAFTLSTEELSSREKSSVSSYILSLLPTVPSSTDHQKLTKHGNQHGFRSTPLQSLSMRWKSKGFTWEDRPLDQNADYEALPNTCEEPTEIPENILDQTPERNINGSHRNEEASISHGLKSFLSDVVNQSTFISSPLFEFLESSIPNIVKACQWVLLYSTRKHGISLHTLIRKSADLPGPCLLIVGDMQGAVFGGLLDAPLKPTAKRKYQGSNQTFVFTTIYGDPRLFRPTGANRYYYLCLNEFLAFGGGGSFALCLDEDLLSGTSGPSDTFGNLCLAYSPEFELKNVEIL
ncbi:hypothetical protein Taro_048947 [Colocasia esculenta]|uniref:TLDc domain-containing protein n=1 Tax=Colocasia esculenta TaxID=4460 RepID=A0A843X9K2_COLES|nr:hypothetical protein [Colocasia esculenta]